MRNTVFGLVALSLLSSTALAATSSNAPFGAPSAPLSAEEQAAIKQGQTIYAFKRDLFRQPIPDQLPFWEYFATVA